jgi:hypothetical protein
MFDVDQWLLPIYVWLLVVAPMVVRYLDPSVDSYVKRVAIGGILTGCLAAAMFILSLVVIFIDLVT